MSGVELALAFLSGVVTGVPTSVRAKGFGSKPNDNKATHRPAVGGTDTHRPGAHQGQGGPCVRRTMRARGEPGWVAAMVGECTMEVRKTGRGERIGAVMSDAGRTVQFVRETLAREHAHTA